MSNPRVSKTNGSSGGAAGGRKPKRHLPASEKYELWVSVLTGQAFLVLQPRAPQSLYMGGGVGLTGISFGQSGDLDDEWHGRGVQGRGTVGYAFRRSTADLRWHVEAGLTTPVRALRRSTRRGAPDGTRRIYPWSIALGVGW